MAAKFLTYFIPKSSLLIEIPEVPIDDSAHSSGIDSSMAHQASIDSMWNVLGRRNEYYSALGYSVDLQVIGQ